MRRGERGRKGTRERVGEREVEGEREREREREIIMTMVPLQIHEKSQYH